MDIGGSDLLENRLKASENNQQINDHQQNTLPICSVHTNAFIGHSEKVNEDPIVGMEFDTEDIAFDFYCKYAHRIGFSVRKQYVKRTKTGLVKRITYCCSKQGERLVDKRREQVFYHHSITRVGCMAQMTCLLQKNGKFKVVAFNAEHNHAFAISPMKHMLRSRRKIMPAQKLKLKMQRSQVYQTKQ